MVPTTRGFVRWYSVKLGYGFIGADVFVGDKSLQPNDLRVSPHNPTGWLIEGDLVEYEVSHTNRQGPRAINVKLIRSNVS